MGKASKGCSKSAAPDTRITARRRLLDGSFENTRTEISRSAAGAILISVLAGRKLRPARLSMGHVQGVPRETIAYAREKIGDDAVGEIVGAIPGLSQFV